MPEMQQQRETGANLSLSALDAASRYLDDGDYALGCECADPSLQIERWNEVLAPARELS